MAGNDGERGAGGGGRRKPDPITIDLNATSVRVEPDASGTAKAEPTASEPSSEHVVKPVAEPEPVAEPASTPRADPAAAVEPAGEATPTEDDDRPAAEPTVESPVLAATAEGTVPPGSEPPATDDASISSGGPREPDGESSTHWLRTLAAALLGGVVGIAGVHFLSAVGLPPAGSSLIALDERIDMLDKKVAALTADPEHSLAAVTKELQAEKARVASLNTEIEKLKQLPQVPGASVGEIARILEPFSGRVSAAVMHMDDIEKRVAAEQAVVRGEAKATGEAVTERVAKVEASVNQRLAAVEATTTDDAAKTAKSTAAVATLTRDFAALDKRVSGDVAVARGEARDLANATTAKFTAIETATATLADGIKGNSGEVAKLKTGLDALSGKLSDLDKRISAELAVIRGTSNDFASQTQKQVSDTGTTLSKLETRMAALDEMQHAVDGLGARIGAFDEVKKMVEAQSARLGQVEEAKKAADSVAASLWTVDQRMANLQARLAEVDALKAQLAAGADKIGTLNSRVAPLEEKLAKFDDWAKAGLATRNEAVAAIAIASLKSAVDAGKPFSAELKAAKTIAGAMVDLSGLDPYGVKGLATEADLVAAYPKVARQALDAAELSARTEGGVLGTLLAHATQSVKIRREGEVAGDAPDARLARIEARLGAHDLAGALTEWQGLPDPLRRATGDWGAALQARVEGAKVMASVTDEVLAKLNAATK